MLRFKIPLLELRDGKLDAKTSQGKCRIARHPILLWALIQFSGVAIVWISAFSPQSAIAAERHAAAKDLPASSFDVNGRSKVGPCWTL